MPLATARRLRGAAAGVSVSMPVRIMRERMSNIAASAVLSAVGQVEGFVDQRKVGHDVAEDRVFEQRPVLPRRIVRMAAADGSLRPGFESDQPQARAILRSRRFQARFGSAGGTLVRTGPSDGPSSSTRHRRRDSTISSNRTCTRAATSPDGLRDQLWRQLVIGRPGMVRPQIARRCPTREPPGQPRQASRPESGASRPASRKRS